MKKLLISKAASADLRDIYAYTYSQWGEVQADSYLDDLRVAMDAIAEGRALSRPLESKHENIFKIKQGRHLVIFQKVEADQIFVLRVLHERMDIDSRLSDVKPD